MLEETTTSILLTYVWEDLTYTKDEEQAYNDITESLKMLELDKLRRL